MRDGSFNFDYLDEFVYLAESLSYKRTADHFYVSRSVISRHMVALEDVVGTRLLDRDSRGVNLTPAGSVFYREAATLLRDWEVALDRVRAATEEGKLLVRLGYLRNAARPVLVRFVRHMSQVHPEITFSLQCMEYNELRLAIDKGSVEVALGVNVHPSLSRNYRTTPIYEDRFYAVCAKDHPLARREEISIEDLRGQKLLLPDSYVYAGLSDIIDEFVDEKGMVAARSFYRDIDMLYLKVQTEEYVAFSSGMNNAIFSDSLAVLPIHDADTSFAVSAFYHDEFIGAPFRACCDGFEWCRAALLDFSPEFKLQLFGQ